MKLSLKWLTPVLLIGLMGIGSAQNMWHWHWGNEFDTKSVQSNISYYLTRNSGAHAVDMAEYSSGGTTKTWISILAESIYTGNTYNRNVRAFEYSDLLRNTWYYPENDPVGFNRGSGGDQHNFSHGQVVLSPNNDKLYSAIDYQFGGGGSTWFPTLAGFYHDDGVTDQTSSYRRVTDLADCTPDSSSAIELFHDDEHACIVYTCQDAPDDNDFWLEAKYSTNAGNNWISRESIVPASSTLRATHPSLVANNYQGSQVLVAFDYNYDGNGSSEPYAGIYVLESTNHGEDWPTLAPSHTPRVSGLAPSEPCLAASVDNQFVILCWTYSGAIKYQYSNDFGGSWSSTATVPFFGDNEPDIALDRPNATVVSVNGHPGILLAVRAKSRMFPDSRTSVLGTFGQFYDGLARIIWRNEPPMCSKGVRVQNDPVHPNVAALDYSQGHAGGEPHAVYVRSAPWAQGRKLIRRSAYWHQYEAPPLADQNTARRLSLGSDGAVHFACDELGCYEAGEMVGQYPLHEVAGVGGAAALAVDGDDQRWVTFVYDDTVYCHMPGELAPRAVFAGSSSAVPGQPSIVCYPNQASGVYVGSVVFPVYDTAGAASKIMYARVDTGGVVLDTIESVANLGDSLPCVNVYLSDSLVVTWQHGDSTLASMLCDYGPGTAGRPAAWSSPNLVTANGYHAMSRFDDNGTALNVVWTRKNGSNYAIQRATCDLSTSLFGNWSQMATPGDTGSAEKTNPVFAGLGVSCWQEKDANGKWTIKGFVRGEEETFVANDTNAYHPHAVAESSAISPSIDQVRVHLLYTAGVTFEVDSGVYDTGETRYVCESLNVSRATSDATKYNNGAKLVRKNGSDSLFSVYADLDNAVVFAWSANGDTWQRSVLASGRDYPTIAEDSSGKRWVVVRKPSQTLNPPIQEAYYRNGSSWTGPETLYSVSGTTLGPASLSGSSYTTSGIAYAAFLSTATGGTQSLILAKFNGSSVSTYTVATGSSLGDPSITVEPYKSDSDRIHVTWEDNGTIKYRMDTDGRSTSIANNWTAVHDLTGRGIVAAHPYTNSDADQIVVAWAQGDTTDIYSRKRSTDSAYNNWEIAANLSNTSSKASDYPTIAMGDSVIVAWEETRSQNDRDILVCIDFGDTLNVSDNATVSGYPHVLFYNKSSGDTAIPYLHTIWSETPEAEYYEVGYNKLNLKQTSGEGGQSANSVPIPVKPSLASCRPNPLKSHTQISYALPTASNVSLQVYDVTGRAVRTLASGHQQAGNYSVSWDAKDSRGRQVPRGVYFYRLDTPGFRAVKKAVVAR
ncbi:T9SS type A sorting domain-containing protein [candidate division WOR-3 bacterium]|uniref:T9SS type A sorting domain-containing protein n=1 Tax=candidate division WOR-3 bacterium TaxID=2052148 RepID=A0A937XGJ3_UNCW3|nr:T9SS type A sorting domain-containing protein [candidate division WOR-3 bacterium]